MTFDSLTREMAHDSACRYDGVMPANDPMQVLAAAVTPVVLVSATAILIGGVNARYIAIADKMRALAQEFRSTGTNPSRRAVIVSQMTTFRSRIQLVAWAERVLYAAVASFILVALLISGTAWRKMLESITLPLFALGIALLFVAIVCQIMELQMSNRTLNLEIKDVVAD